MGPNDGSSSFHFASFAAKRQPPGAGGGTFSACPVMLILLDLQPRVVRLSNGYIDRATF